MRIVIGQTVASMMNPPNEGTVVEHGIEWTIKRNGYGMIVLKDSQNKECHAATMGGLDMLEFVSWINSKL
jgi:hypothetical protein